MTNPAVFESVCARADAASAAQQALARATGDTRNMLLLAIADALDAQADAIAEANAEDMDRARADGMDDGKLDRLLFDAERVRQSAQGVRHVAGLPDPIGEIVRGSTLPNGLRLNQVRVPLGVIGMGQIQVADMRLVDDPVGGLVGADRHLRIGERCAAATPRSAPTRPRCASSAPRWRPTASTLPWSPPSTTTDARGRRP